MTRIDRKEDATKMGTVLIQLQCPSCQNPAPLFPCDSESIDEVWKSMGERFTMRCPACSKRLSVVRSGQAKDRAIIVRADNAENKCEQVLQIKQI